MNLKDRIKLINDIVKENDNSTIADYAVSLQEIEDIENGVKQMVKKVEETTRQQILRLAADMTAKQIKMQTGIPFSTIYKALKEQGFDVLQERKRRREELFAGKRPPAIYSNPRPYDSLHQNQKTA